jgi:hypothetical protein
MATMQLLNTRNNQGIAFLESEDTENAIDMFCRGFIVLRQAQAPMRWIAGTADSGNQRCQILPCNVITSLSHENIYVFNKAIMIREGGNSADVNRDVVSESESFCFASVFLFNSALAHHLKGKLSGQVKYFYKASKLYDSIVRLILYHCHQDKRLQHIVVIALNNRAQIHYEYLSDHLTSQQLFQVMSDIMVRQGTDGGMDQEGLHCILQNALCIRYPCSAGAA